MSFEFWSSFKAKPRHEILLYTEVTLFASFAAWYESDSQRIFLIEASGNLLYTLMLWKNEIFSRYIKSCQNWLTLLQFARLWLFNGWNIFSPMWPNLIRTSSMLLWFHWTKEKQRYHWYWCKWQIENSRNSAKQAFGIKPQNLWQVKWINMLIIAGYKA